MSEQVAEGFQFEGVKYEFSTIMLKEARDIQRTTGMTPVQWEKAINEGDAEAITALIWVARRRHGEDKLRFDDVDGDIATFVPYLEEPESETDDEPGKAPGPDDLPETSAGPVSAEGSTPSNSTTAPASGVSTVSATSTPTG